MKYHVLGSQAGPDILMPRWTSFLLIGASVEVHLVWMDAKPSDAQQPVSAPKVVARAIEGLLGAASASLSPSGTSVIVKGIDGRLCLCDALFTQEGQPPPLPGGDIMAVNGGNANSSPFAGPASAPEPSVAPGQLPSIQARLLTRSHASGIVAMCSLPRQVGASWRWGRGCKSQVPGRPIDFREIVVKNRRVGQYNLTAPALVHGCPPAGPHRWGRWCDASMASPWLRLDRHSPHQQRQLRHHCAGRCRRPA